MKLTIMIMVLLAMTSAAYSADFPLPVSINEGSAQTFENMKISALSRFSPGSTAGQDKRSCIQKAKNQAELSACYDIISEEARELELERQLTSK